MGGVLTTAKKKVVAAFSYTKKKISAFWDWLPNWVKKTISGVIAVIRWLAVAAWYLAKLFFSILRWFWNCIANADFEDEPNSSRQYRNTSSNTYRQANGRRDNGHSWYHQPNIRNSYGWDKKPM